MRTKKRNMVMEILVCTVLVSVVFLGYMCFAKDNSSMKITDVSGDRAALNAFACACLSAIRCWFLALAEAFIRSASNRLDSA